MNDLPAPAQEWITQRQLADICGNYEAVRKRLQRETNIVRSYTTTDRGRELRISVASLVEHGWITKKQAQEISLHERPQVSLPSVQISEGDMLMLNSAVMKKLKDLSETELRVLDLTVPDWQSLTLNKILHRLSHMTGKHRSWFQRDHRVDRRRERSSSLSLVTPEQELVLKNRIISIRMKKNFVDECMRDADLPRLSVRTWYRIAAELQEKMKDEILYTQKGAIALRQTTEPILRDRTHLKPLEAIVGDYWRVDKIVRWVDGSLTRPALAVWVDFRTNLIVGSCLAKNPNSLGVKTSLFDCFVRYGIPSVCYMDNGKEYRAQRIAGLNDETIAAPGAWMDELDSDIKKFEYRGIIPALSIRDMRAIVRNARAKPIERIFGRGGFTDWAKEFQDWSGSKYWQMPEAVKHAMTAYRQGKTYVDKVTGEAFTFCDVRELTASMSAFIDFHNARASRGFGMDGLAPRELYAELAKEFPPRRADVHEIAFAFLEGKVMKVRATSHIEFKHDQFYRADALWSYRGQQVHVRYNPISGYWWVRADGRQAEYLPSVLYVFDEEGRYITDAVPVERTHPLTAEVSFEMSRQRQTLAAAKRNVREISQGIIEKSGPLQVVDIKTLPDEAARELAASQKAADKAREEERKKNNPYLRIDII